MGRSKLKLPYFSLATARNLNTLKAVLAMARSLQERLF